MLPPQADVDLYRAALADVDVLTQRDLLTVWRQLDLTDAKAAGDLLADALPGIIADGHAAAGTVAADWYDLMRYDAEVPKRFSAVVAEAPTVGRARALAGWSVGPLFGADPNPLTALSKVSGGLQRAVLNGARSSIVESTRADPVKVGWMRVGKGECDWCRRYLDGQVHYVAGYDFDAHDRCRCTAVMHWG